MNMREFDHLQARIDKGNPKKRLASDQHARGESFMPLVTSYCQGYMFVFVVYVSFGSDFAKVSICLSSLFMFHLALILLHSPSS